MQGVLKKYGLKFRYSGELLDGKAEGQGSLSYLNGLIYKGNFSKGKFHGLGELKFSNGIVYEGEFVDGLFNGHGILKFLIMEQNNFEQPYNYYLGEFKNGVFQGKGYFQWVLEGKRQTHYEGQWINGQIEGQGTFYFDNCSQIINAFFKDGLPHGQVHKQQQFSRCSLMYKGQLESKSQKMTGFGELINTRNLTNAENQNYKYQYIGVFKQDRMDGQSQLSFMDQYGGYATYFGEMKNNLFEGKGELIFSNGDKYTGSFSKGLFNGEGQLLQQQGKLIYKGQFKSGKICGRGFLKILGQYRLDGWFENGKISEMQIQEMIFDNGDNYRGYMKNMNFDGPGMYFVKKENYRIIGQYKNGVPHGPVKKIYFSRDNSNFPVQEEIQNQQYFSDIEKILYHQQ